MVLRFRLRDSNEHWLANVLLVREEQLNSYIGTLVLKDASELTTWIYQSIEDIDSVVEDLARRADLQQYHDHVLISE